MEGKMMGMASKLPFFSKLTEEELHSLVSGMKEAEFKAGSIIFSEGDAGDEMFVLIDGVVEITTRIGETVDKTLITLRSSGVFGEMSLISGLPRSGTARVLENSRFLTINAATFSKFCVGNPSAGVKLQEHLLNIISDRLRNTTDLYRHAAEWGLNISGIIQLDFNRLVAENRNLTIELSNGKEVSGVLLKVEKHENGTYEFYLKTKNNSFRIIPYHAIASIGFQDQGAAKSAGKGGENA